MTGTSCPTCGHSWPGCICREPMPNPSNSDLVGETGAVSYLDLQKRCGELAQQLERAEQRVNVLRRWIGVVQADAILHAALTTPDSATEQEEG